MSEKSQTEPNKHLLKSGFRLSIYLIPIHLHNRQVEMRLLLVVFAFGLAEFVKPLTIQRSRGILRDVLRVRSSNLGMGRTVCRTVDPGFCELSPPRVGVIGDQKGIPE